MAQIVFANLLAQVQIALRGATGLDPGILVGRNGLRGELAAYPIRLLSQDDPQTVARRR